jgi:PST family polysaccharide transporter/lipopolysaccharide exporter
MLWVGGLPARLTWNGETNKQALRYGVTAIGSTIFWIIYSTADNICVGKLFGAEILGYYAMAFYLTELPLSKINSMMSPVAAPYYSKLRHNVEALYNSFLLISRAIVGIIAPALLGLALVAPQFIGIFLGAKWTPMVLPLQVLSIVGLMRGMTTNGSILLLAINRPDASLVAAAIPGVVLPPFFYFAGLAWGINGIFAVWLFVYPLLGPALYFVIMSRVSGYRMSLFVNNLSAPLVSTFLMIAAIGAFNFFLFFKETPTVSLIFNVSLGAAIYVGSLWFFYRQETLECIAIVQHKDQS